MGLKASKDNKDISSSIIDDFPLHSSFNTLKVFMQGIGTASVTTNVKKEINIDHNLGYKPLVLFYFKHPDNDRWYLAPVKADTWLPTHTSGWTMLGVYNHQSVNRVQLKLYDGYPFSAMPSSPTDVDYKYFILVDPRADAWYE